MNEGMHLNVQRLLLCWKSCQCEGAAKREIKAVVLDENLKMTG